MYRIGMICALALPLTACGGKELVVYDALKAGALTLAEGHIASEPLTSIVEKADKARATAGLVCRVVIDSRLSFIPDDVLESCGIVAAE